MKDYYAILGVPGAGDDPNLSITSLPDLTALPKTPEVKTIALPLMNTGSGGALAISGVTISGSDASHFSVGSFPESIAAGGSGTLNITFDTKGQVGDFQAEVQINSNDESTAEYIVELRPRVVAPALLGFCSFDDEANPLKDDSGANRTLTAPAMPIYEAAGGIEGGAFLFDGTHRLAAPININPGSVPNLTMGAWVRTDALEGLHKILGHDDGGWDRTLGLDNRGAGTTTHYTAFAGRGAYPLTDPLATPYDTTLWSFVAVVYEQDANRVTTYVDLDVASEDDPLLTGTTSTTLGGGASSVGIGGIAPTGTGEPWIGHIDNVFFVEGAFDGAQMEELRNQGKAFFAAGLQPDPILAFVGGTVFGDVPGSGAVTREVRISNTGSTQPLRVSRVELSGPDAGLYSIGELPDPIAPGAEGTISVTLNPGDRLGGVNAQLAVYSNNSGSRVANVNLNAYVPFPSARSALVAFYPFDEADPLADATGGGATATIDPLFEPFYDASAGYEGGAYVFSEAQRIAAPVNINPSAAPKLTMGAWVKTGNLDPVNRKFMGHDNGGWDRAIGIDNRGNGGLTTHHYTAFAGRDAFPLTDPPATPVSTEDWTFFAAVYDQLAATVTTYIDMDASTTGDSLLTASVTTTMGEGLGNLGIGAISATGNEFWNGVIDNVFVYETELTEAQITAIRDGGAAAILAMDEPDIEITGIERDDNVSLTWSSSAGETYNIQYKATLDDDWSDIATVPGEAGSTTYTDTDAARMGRPTGFYRIAQ